MRKCMIRSEDSNEEGLLLQSYLKNGEEPSKMNRLFRAGGKQGRYSEKERLRMNYRGFGLQIVLFERLLRES